MEVRVQSAIAAKESESKRILSFTRNRSVRLVKASDSCSKMLVKLARDQAAKFRQLKRKSLFLGKLRNMKSLFLRIWETKLCMGTKVSMEILSLTYMSNLISTL